MRTRQEWLAERSARVRANLHRAMTERGVGRTELAERSGVRQHILGEYLDGARTPAFAVLDRLAATLGLADGATLDADPEQFGQHLAARSAKAMQTDIASRRMAEAARAAQPVEPIAPPPVDDPAEIVGTVIAAAGMSEQQFAGHLQHLLADPAGKAYLRVAVLGLRKAL